MRHFNIWQSDSAAPRSIKTVSIDPNFHDDVIGEVISITRKAFPHEEGDFLEIKAPTFLNEPKLKRMITQLGDCTIIQSITHVDGPGDWVIVWMNEGSYHVTCLDRDLKVLWEK